jgi:hypothetical protein
MGVMTIGRRPVAMAMATRPADGSHETGIANLTAIARWLAGHAHTTALPKQPEC